MRIRKIAMWLGLGFIAVVALGALGLYVASERVLRAPVQAVASQLATPTPAQRADAHRQLRVLGCTGCHGRDLRGKLIFDEPPVAKLHAPNLTLIAARASDAVLDRAIRQGIGHAGNGLFVMPSQQYQFLSDGEAAALIGAIREFPVGGVEIPARQLGPIGRLGIATGKFRGVPALVAEYRQQRLPDLGPDLASGRHLVETSCTECHGPLLRGQEVKPGSVAPDLGVVLAYDDAQFRHLLRTGVALGDRKLGLMGEVAVGNLHALTDAEIRDIRDYLVARARQPSAGTAP